MWGSRTPRRLRFGPFRIINRIVVLSAKGVVLQDITPLPSWRLEHNKRRPRSWSDLFVPATHLHSGSTAHDNSQIQLSGSFAATSFLLSSVRAASVDTTLV